MCSIEQKNLLCSIPVKESLPFILMYVGLGSYKSELFHDNKGLVFLNNNMNHYNAI